MAKSIDELPPEQEEQSLKIKELKLKIRDLEKPDYKKPATWTSLLAVVIALGSVAAQNYWSGIKRDIVELDLRRANLARDSADRYVADANKRYQHLVADINSANNEYDSVKRTINRQLDSIRNLLATVQAQSGRVSEASLNEVKHIINRTQQNLSTPIQNVTPDIKNNNPVDKSGDPAELTPSRKIDESPQQEDPDDPQKGKWGGLAVVNGRQIYDTVIERRFSKLYNVVITVVSTDPTKPLTGKVIFHLHNSFKEPVQSVDVVNGKAELSLLAYGAFTVGAQMDDGKTKLELDLSKQKGPEAFLRR